MFDSPDKLLLGLVTGVAFGFLLQKGRVAKFPVIVGQFLLKDWTVVKVMATAVAVGAVGVYALVGGRARKQGVALRFARSDGPVWADGDQDQLQQLVLNLVLNAMDAMPDGGAVEVEVRPPRDGTAELLCRDTGPGIAAHILPKVFETFVSSKETGIGLGLPVSKRIAEDHGGALTAYNLPAGGACFALRLPVAA